MERLGEMNPKCVEMSRKGAGNAEISREES